MNLQPVINRVGEILSDPRRRCVGTLATDEYDRPTDVTDENARCWCLVGALQKSLHEHGVLDKSEQNHAYELMKDVIGLDESQSAPVFWDNNEALHQVIANRLKIA